MLNKEERARLYNEGEFGTKYPDSKIVVCRTRIFATWFTGNNYQNHSSLYGAYPPDYIRRIATLFPDSRTVLHLFSGSLTKEQVQAVMPNAEIDRLDIRPEAKPDFVADAETFWEENWGKHTYDLILADPPYSVEDAEHYGPCLCNKKEVFRQCHEALVQGGTLVWMDQSMPMWKKTDWKWYGCINIWRSTNHRCRGVLLFEKI